MFKLLVILFIIKQKNTKQKSITKQYQLQALISGKNTTSAIELFKSLDRKENFYSLKLIAKIFTLRSP